MPILSSKIDSMGQAGSVPKIIYLATNDTLAEVTVTGYLNGFVQQNNLVSESDIALITTKTSPYVDSTQVSWLEVARSGRNWSLVSIAAPSTVATIAGTANRITVTGTTNAVIDISASYVGQASITTLGTITTGVWNGTPPDVAHGGTGASSFTPYAIVTGGTTATGALQNVVGVGTLGQVLTSAGAGALPTWTTIAGGGDMVLAAVQTNTGAKTFNSGTLIYAGSSSGTITVNAPAAAGSNTIVWPAASGTVALTSGIPSLPISLANGGTSASLAASNGGIFYSTATAGAILAGTATAGQVLRSGSSAAPSWSTATYPATAAVAGKVLRANGTNWVESTAVFADTYTANELLMAVSSNNVSTLPTAVSSILVTSAGGVPSWASSLPSAVMSNITTVGTITSGTWNGSTITVPYGGTGNTTFTAYSVICAGATATGSFQNVSGLGSAGQVLTSNGAAALPTWQSVGAGTVTSVSGTANRITSTGGTTPVIDISASYVGQASITTLGTVATGVWNGSLIPLAYGGTNKNMTADNGGIVYSDADSLELLAATATAGQMLRSGSNAAPSWSTATFPATAGSAGTILRADGTNWVASTATFANTYSASALLYSNGANAVTGLAPTNNAVLTSNASGVPTWAALTNGQIIIGSTAGAPIAATISAGAGINVTTGANSIAISSTVSGITWNNISGTTQNAAVNNGYVVGNAGQTTITLPGTAALGSVVHIAGKGAGGWILAANTGQTIQIGSQVTSSAGTLVSAAAYDSVMVVCITANTTWSVLQVLSTGLTIT